MNHPGPTFAESLDIRALNTQHHVHPMADPTVYRDARPLIPVGGDV